jgi:hypothetical protein
MLRLRSKPLCGLAQKKKYSFMNRTHPHVPIDFFKDRGWALSYFSPSGRVKGLERMPAVEFGRSNVVGIRQCNRCGSTIEVGEDELDSGFNYDGK